MLNPGTAGLAERTSLGIKEKLAAFAELTKPRIAVLLVLTAAAAFYVASARFDIILFLHSMTGIMLLAFGVAALNQAMERGTDALMERTAARPLPTGRVSIIEAWLFGAILSSLAILQLLVFVNSLTALLGVLVIIGYVFLYTPLKTRTTASTAIGAIPGAMPPLMGWTSVSGEITLGAWALFVFLFLWQFPHFLAIAWMYRDDYAKAGILMLPVVEKDGRITSRQIVMFGMLTVVTSLAPFFLGFAGWIYLIASIILGGWFLMACIRAARAKNVPAARKLLLATVAYLPFLLLVLVLDKR
ncbi:MAG: heme o synthase [Pyrinomonadaceae bacterium]|jgi:protoheme IX farnesyltransferase